MSSAAFQGSIELGIIYAIMSLGVFLSFRTLNMPDLTVDSSFTLGAATAAMMCYNGDYVWGTVAAFLAGCLGGCVTALLHTKLKIQPLLSGILVMLGLYSINLKVMDNRPNIPLVNKTTIFTFLKESPLRENAELYTAFFLLLLIVLVLFFFLKTKLGFVLRATGDNAQMVRALGVNTDTTILIGLALSNGLVALSGAMIAQYQSFADVSMGIGMVVIGLASVIIGEVLWGTSSLLRRLIAVVIGSIFYRLIIAYALELGMPPTDLKLVSALIVTLALSMPVIKERLQVLRNRYLNNRKLGRR